MPWHLWGCMAIAFLIPFVKKFVPGFIVLLSVYVLVYAIKRKGIHVPKFNTPHVMLFGIFLLHLIGLLWSDHRDEGLNEIGIKLSYAVFPLIAWLMPPLRKTQTNSVLLSFLYGSLAFIPLAIGYGIYRSIIHHDIAWLTYQQLGIYLHPTYAATYMAFALLILWKSEMNGEKPMRNTTFAYVSGIVILIFISMLASKAGFIAALLVIGFGGYYTFRKRRVMRDVVLHVAAAILVLGISAAVSPGSITRVGAALDDLEEKNNVTNETTFVHVEAKSSTALRMVSWRAAGKIILEQPIGAGTGDTQFAINEKYLEADEQYAASKNLNAHNQFLQAGCEHGWLGMVMLISLMTIFFLYAIKIKNLLMIAFITLCGMNFLFESFLEVQAGIVFFCFMVMLFAKQDQP